jgi:hypothetical protein
MKGVRGGIQNIPDWCRHLYSSCGSAKHLFQKAKLWILGSNATFAAIAWKRANSSPRILARTDLAASPWQRPVSHFCSYPAVSGELKMAVIPATPYTPDLAHCDFFLFPTMKLKLKGRRFDTMAI